jgi:hypothetical protein
MPQQTFFRFLCFDVPAPLNTIGQATSVTVHVHDVHGVSKFTATVEQNGARYEAWQSTAASKDADSTFSFSIGTKATPQLRDGTPRSSKPRCCWLSRISVC